MNEIAVIEQLPIITEQIKEIGVELDKRLESLNLEELICDEDTRKSITELRASLTKELKDFESQRKDIKTKVLSPYEEFNKIYEEEIKKKYVEADYLLKTKIDLVDDGIKEKTKIKMIEFFEEQKKSKGNIQEQYLSFEELNIKLGINLLTAKGDLVKKVKDEIINAVNEVSTCIETISTMDHNDEILVEYLKHKNLTIAIRDVNDRHTILDAIKESNKQFEEQQKQEETVIEKVDEVLKAPIEEEKLYTVKFSVTHTKEKLKELKQFLINGGYKYE